MTMATEQRSGRFGRYGGQYVPETLMGALDELVEAYEEAWADPEFHKELEYYWRHYAGRPTPLYLAERLSDLCGTQVYLKREDLNHTGAHKLNNTLGQVLLARRMGKPRLVAETGAGQHGVATATVGALFGMETVVYMGVEDIRRQRLNCFRMELLGARIEPVESGKGTLKDATNEAIRDWMTNVENTHYLMGSVCGPHPYPTMVRDFQSIIGQEVREQCSEQIGRLPDMLVACVGGGSNAIGLFYPFIEDDVKLVGVEGAGHGLHTGEHSAPLAAGSFGILHGSASQIMQDEDGQIINAHSVAAGLDYPGVGPEHAYLQESGRATYVSVTDDQALDAFDRFSKLEGIIPALEAAHALAWVIEQAGSFDEDEVIVINLSGRGDKDAAEVKSLL